MERPGIMLGTRVTRPSEVENLRAWFRLELVSAVAKATARCATFAWFNLVLLGKWAVSAWFLEGCTAGCRLRGFRAGTAGEVDGDEIFGAWFRLDLLGKWAFSTGF